MNLTDHILPFDSKVPASYMLMIGNFAVAPHMLLPRNFVFVVADVSLGFHGCSGSILAAQASLLGSPDS